ncbi:hypothetical protein B0H15DRAFT_942974 [Mycena belliarum]|uniref:GST N-terminal domain-containing protein n=1 Tax=Mycena belliarum TaxID=1033014 RepID=A0AAD6UME1_9AGAR|nr:hypothetical protein B0H15DRAFT_942974 [Mycena belliae]
MSASVPKAVLYYSPDSVWSTAVLLALEEKGYADDELVRKVVDLAKGENFSVSYLRLNLKGTVPTLVVPFRDSLGDDVESRYKAVTDPKAIIALLDQSRSPLSRTRTTSTAPAPSLAPATVAFSAASSALLDILHDEEVSPDMLMLVNARDAASLKTLAQNALPVVAGRQKALAQCLSDSEAGSIQASEKVKQFWRQKLSETQNYLSVLKNADREDAELDAQGKTKRAEFFGEAKAAWEVTLKDTIARLNKEIIGPYALGDQLSIADLSLAAWIRSLVILAGGALTDDGVAAIGKLEAHIGGGFSLPKDFKVVDARRKGDAEVSKLAGFWEAMGERASWKKVYRSSD